MSMKATILRASASAIAMAASLSSVALAQTGRDVLIVNGISLSSERAVTEEITRSLTQRQSAAGNLVTVADGLPVNLNGHDQIWDIRFSYLSPLTTGEQQRYQSFLQGGKSMVVMGENADFYERNDSIAEFIQRLGGGEVKFVQGHTIRSAEQVLAIPGYPDAFTGGQVTFDFAHGLTDVGRGQCLTVNRATRHCTAVAYTPGSLTNAAEGALVAVFDVDFLEARSVNDERFINNLIAFVSTQIGEPPKDDKPILYVQPPILEPPPIVVEPPFYVSSPAMSGAPVTAQAATALAEAPPEAASRRGFLIFAATPYQEAVAGAFNAGFGRTSDELSRVMVQVAGLSEGQAAALESAANSFPDLPFHTGFRIGERHHAHALEWLDRREGGAAPAPLGLIGLGAESLAAGAESFADERFAFHLSGAHLDGAVGATRNQAGYDYRGPSITGGVSYAVTSNLEIGAALGYSSLAASVEDRRAQAETSGVTGLVFGRYRNGGFYGDFVGGATAMRSSHDRRIEIGALGLQAKGATEGLQWGVTARAGYDLPLMESGLTIGPFAQIRSLRQSYDAFRETGAGTADLLMEKQSETSTAGRIGLRLAGSFAAGGAVVTPSLAVGVERRFGEGSRDVASAFAGAPEASFSTVVEGGARSFAVVEAGLGARLAPNLRIEAAYEGRFGAGERDHALLARLNFEF